MNVEEANTMKKQLLEAYNSCIDEMAKDAIDNKEPNSKLIEDTNMLMNQIRNYDIMIAIEKQKMNTNSEEKTM